MIDESVSNMASGILALKIEQTVKLQLQPKPRWLPTFVWKALLRRLLVIEKTAPSVRRIVEGHKYE